jgi:hypothetical protein
MRGGSRKYLRLNSRALRFSLLAPLLVTLALAQDGTRPSATRQVIFTPKEKFFTYRTEHVENISLDGRPAIRLARKKEHAPDPDDLILDFESPALFVNPAYQSFITQANLERAPHNGMSGQAAVFNLPEHKLKIKLPDYLHLSGTGQIANAGDLTFACEFETHSGNGEILRRENFVNGIHYLFAVTLRNGRVNVKLANLLQQSALPSDSYLESAELKSIDKVKLRKRNYLVLTYSEGSGTLRLTLNRHEQAVYTLPRKAAGNYAISFRNLGTAPFTLFSPFRGYADNVLFSNRVLSDDEYADFGSIKPYGDRYDQRTGSLTTGIFDMRYSASTIESIKADIESSDENALIVTARCLNKRFDPMLADSALRFISLEFWRDKKCRFIQFHAKFVADNQGNVSPALRRINLLYRENPPPQQPFKPRIISSSAESIMLEIPPNTELDVVHGGRYIIYYGHKKLKPEGAIYFKSGGYTGAGFEGQPILHRTPIRVEISNATISQNKSWADRNPRFKYRYPVFSAGIGYYFWITACDNAYGDAQELADHESQPSEAVFHRF